MMDDKDWVEFKKKLKAKTEIDLDLYKEPQMKRRIGNLVTRGKFPGYTAYFDHVSQDKDDFAAFIEDFAAYADLLQPGQAQQVQCGFRVAVAHEDTALDAGQGKYMSRPGKIIS